MISYLLITFGVEFSCYIINVEASENFYDPNCPLQMPFLIIDFIASLMEIFGDIYMAFKAVSHFLFFIRIKRKKLENEGNHLSCYNFSIITLLFIVLIMNMWNSISRIFFTSIIEHELVGMDYAELWNSLDLLNLNVIIPIEDFFTQLTFLYLFYYQARTKQKIDLSKSD